jgi:cutinase
VTIGHAAVAAAHDCADVDVVFARGTSEPPGIGRVGEALTDALRPQLGGRTVTTYAVNYPASYDFLNAQDGANDATSHIVAQTRECPGTRIVLGGYSQGAAIVDMLVGVPPLGTKIGEIGSAPPLPYEAAKYVAAIAVFGNPATKFGHPVTQAAAPYGPMAIDLCSQGDPICSKGHNPLAHTHYETNGDAVQAANFVAGLLGSQTGLL